MIIVPQAPLFRGTQEENISAMQRYLTELSDYLAITMGLDTGSVTNSTTNNFISNNVSNTMSVDGALDSSSENAVQNKVIKAALDTKLDKSSVDSALNASSANPVQNKVVTESINAANSNISKLPTVQFGTVSVKYSSSDKTTSVTFATAFSSTPVVICQQVFNSVNCCILAENVSTTGFKISVTGMSGVSGTLTRDVMWVAIGN